MMFKFDLVHVPGAFHGPDGLSRRRAHPCDNPEPEYDFDDWIDQVHGFLHMMLPVSQSAFEQTPATLHMLAGSVVDADDDIYDRAHLYCIRSNLYDTVPCTNQARSADDRTHLVQKWHADLHRLPDMTDAKYESFL